MDENRRPAAAYRDMVAGVLRRALEGDEAAYERLVALAAGERVAAWALQVVLELRVEAAEAAGGLPSLDRDVEQRLNDAALAAARRADTSDA